MFRRVSWRVQHIEPNITNPKIIAIYQQVMIVLIGKLIFPVLIATIG